MKICFYGTIRNWPWAAPDYVWPFAAKKFLKRGDKVLVCAPEIHQQRPELQELRAMGADIMQIPNYSYRGGRRAALQRALSGEASERRRLRHSLERFAPDLVFLNQGGTACALAEPDLMEFLRATKTPYVLFCRLNQRGNPPTEKQRAEILDLYRRADRVLFNSVWMLDLAQKQLMTRLPNAGIFPHLVRFDYEKPLAWPDSDVPLLASISRLDVHHKGLDVLLEAVALLKAEGARFRLELHGYGPDETFLRQYITHLDVGDMVAVCGRATDVREVWRRNQLLVLVSRYEGLAVSMLEAMACGRPVLRTPYGGADWIEDGKTGFICLAPEPELIAESIRRALSQRSALKSMGLAAHVALTERLPKDPERIYLEIADELRSSARTKGRRDSRRAEV
jgi:glycosyltransferase involved in cell wall biosynthesis